MKKNLIILVLVLALTKLYGQEYYVIDFVGEGATIESIYVENLTQGTSVELEGADVLHLILTSTGINHHETVRNQIKIYPNPTDQTCNIEFTNKKEGNVKITLYCIAGKQILSLNKKLPKGVQNFSLSELPAGTYVISVETKTDLFSGRIVSTGEAETSPSLTINVQENGKTSNLKLHNNHKGVKSILEMEYEIGDELKFLGYAEGFESPIILDSPTNDSTYNLIFILFECGGLYTDQRDWNIYKTVQIGDQCWMAENLAYLPSVVGFDSISYTEPLYYVYDYNGTNVSEAKASENYINYGALYNWAAANTSCPPGWYLPTYHEDFMELAIYISSLEWTVNNHSAHYLKSCRQIDSPLGDDCNTSEHPRWDYNETYFGIDAFGFKAIPGGSRGIYDFVGIGSTSYFWTYYEAELSAPNCVFESNSNSFNTIDWLSAKIFGFSVRCIRE